ncbi:MAG: amidohydrolase family protein [Thaumarchaeota archaeon]|nr:amidohydrolase family protein [Candidatus Calditenuaceae archaeon]MDW8186703.1 amidohydrolase family protein [Nitrososphaerota archaeon]
MTLNNVKINDVHVHVNPFSMLHKPALEFFAMNQDFRQNWNRIERDPSYVVKRMDEEGVQRIVLINYVAKEVMGYDLSVNEYVFRYCRGYRDRLIPFGGVEIGLDHTEFARRIEEDYSKFELAGLKLHPVHQLVYANQYLPEYGEARVRNLETLYQFCSDHSVPLTVHTGSSMFPGARIKYGDPLYLDDVLVDFPELTLIMAHGGRPIWMEKAFFLMRRHRNLYLDISGIPPNRLLEYFPRITEIADRVIFGSDWPSPGVKGMRANALEILKLPIPEDVKERILGLNFEHLFRSLRVI